MLSVVVTTCDDDRGCYLTVFGLRQQLERDSLDHELIVVADGGTEVKWESKGVRCLRGQFGSPQAARDAGIKVAHGAHVLVLDSHVVVSDVRRLADEHARLGAALTFPVRVGEGTELFDVYGAETDWEGNLWQRRQVYGPPRTGSWRVGQFGHACLMLDRGWYLASNGYAPLVDKGGFGAEEPLLCLKAWLLGRECWMTSATWNAHHLPRRGAYPDWRLNFLRVAYVLGGEEQLAQAQRLYPQLRLDRTPALQAERDRVRAGPFGGDLTRLRDYFNREKILS